MGFASRVRFAIQAFSIDLGNLPALSELEEVLRTSEAHSFRHANGHSLFTHLTGTRRILEAWGQESRIQMAGLFHSVYSTPVYRKQLISIHRRAEIRGLIGTAGESLVYLFSRLSRETIVKSLGMYLPSEAYCVIDDSAGLEPLKVSRQQLTDLLIIHIANLADQSVGLAGGPGSWLHATGEMSRLLSASSLALPPVLKEIQTIRSRDAESTIRNEYRIGVAEIAQDRIKAVKHFDAPPPEANSWSDVCKLSSRESSAGALIGSFLFA